MTSTPDHMTHLLKAESSFGWMSGMPSGNVVTFFEGSFEGAQTFLAQRLAEIIRANPWICARLYKTKEVHGVAMGWSDADVERELQALQSGTSTLFHVAPPELAAKLDLTRPYKELCQTMIRSKLAVPVGKQCLKENRPLASIVLFPIDQVRFGVWLSASHIIADGYTGYAILGMLLTRDPAAPVYSLEPQRDHRFDAKLTEAIGHREKSILDFSLPGILNALGNHFFAPRPRALALNLNLEAIQEEKKRYLETRGDGSSAPPFISANDIVTSTLGRLLEFSSLYMAINLRSRIALNPDGSDDDRGMTLAGNYESGIFFFGQDFHTPATVRAAQGLIQPGLFQRPPGPSGQLTPIPGFWQRTFGRPGLVTNWSGWEARFELPHCETTLHLPITDIDRPFFESAILFQDKPGQVAVMIFSRVIESIEAVQAFSPIFGSAIHSKLFPNGQTL